MTTDFNPADYPLVGRHVYLRPLDGTDYELIRRSELAGMTALHYRHFGSTPSPEQFVNSLWGGVLAQYMLCSRVNDAPLGMVNCYGADMKNGFGYLAALIFAPYRRHPMVHEGIELFISYLWRAFPFRKLYADTIGPNLSQFASASRAGWVEEGRLVEHQYVDGRYVDKVTLAISRERWFERLPNGRATSELMRRVREEEAALASRDRVTQIGEDDA